MIRSFAIEIALFLLPFVLYAGWLALRRRNPFTGASWSALDLASLTVVGFFLSVVLFGLGWRYGGDQISGRNEPPPPAAGRPR